LTIGAAPAAEINAFVSTAIKAATDEILPPFERANGHTIRASYAPSGALVPRFLRGEPVDIFLTDAPALDELIKQGKIAGGRVSVLVSSGQAEIGIQQASELYDNPEVEVIGMLPPGLQQITLYSAGITANAKEAEAAKVMIQALTTPQAKAIYKAKGLEPN